MAIAFHNVFISEAFQNCRRTPIDVQDMIISSKSKFKVFVALLLNNVLNF